MRNSFRMLCALLLGAGSALAQSAPLTAPSPDRLPADTWVLVTWHGAGAANKVRASNPLTRMWDDPQFVSAREKLIQKLLDEVGRERKEGDQPFTREDVDDLLTLLENPGVFGVTGDPFAKAAGGEGSVHVFLAYNSAGKGDLVAKLKKKEKVKPNSEVSTYTFRGVEIKKTVTTTPAEPAKPAAKGPEEGEPAEQENPEEPPQPKITYDFEASLGDTELFADNQEVMETLITRMQEKAAPMESLSKNAAYQSAQRFRADGPVVELFVKIPDFNQLPLPPTPQMDMQAFARELHLERIHGLWLSLGLAPDRALVRTALLGDTSPGSILDLIGNNVSDFQTLAASPLSGPYGAFRLDLPALYATLLRAAKAGLPPEQAAAADMVDGIVAMQTGMPLTELLNLFTGEIGTVSTGEEQMAEFLPDVIMIPVTKSEPVLNLLRTLGGTFIRGEETVSGATVLTMAPPPAASEESAKPIESKPFYVAVSPTMLVISPGLPQMSDILARSAAGNPAPAGSLAGDAKFLAVRKMLPAQLNGVSYADWTRLPWDKQLQLMEKQLAKQRQETLDRADAAEKGDENNPPDPKRAEALRRTVKTMEETHRVLIELMPLVQRYFKVSAGGTWKAPDGLFFHSFIN